MNFCKFPILQINGKQDGDFAGENVSTAENQVLQCGVGSTVETMIIHFGQEKFQQFLSGGSTNLLHVRKHRKVSIVRAYLLEASLC